MRRKVPAHAQSEMPVFAKPEGVILMQLNSSGSGHEGVQNIQVRCLTPLHTQSRSKAP
jgi:hypothetical protein